MASAEIQLYFNPGCSKCRRAKELLEDRRVGFELIDYLELGLRGADRDRLLDAMAEHPELLERPIVIRGDRGLVARPLETLLDLL